ncbi:TonB-dependent receptor plug domain-containing protein [Phenylobacterium sp.]|uniref:TonB-dependent receptor plug domain-containing protein n=1 Tax=Phenylobacterium sp. TaxID=1871053 RepID=UPI002C5C9D3B|nr:TonB-dependent receptor [Phenylobacterium sp.]HLZ74211.1 TonB-dependent receptor [Phenylobacterium sp.]
MGASAASAAAADNTVTTSEVVVTAASRIDKAGYDAPTPTTVVGQAELQLGARANVAAVLADLPEVKNTFNPTNTARSAVLSGEQVIDLRGIGSTRTLVLLNGHRFIGDNDLNTVPFDLVKNIEVVTGGASADWGSGAIAGVVNITLDDKLDGGVFNVATGISSRNDGREYRGNAAYGAEFADGKGHFMLDGEWYDNRGIYDLTSRSNVGGWAVLAVPGAPANGQHAFVITNQVGPSNLSEGGLISAGPLKGLSFNPDGSTSAFNFGTLTGAALTKGGSQVTNDAFNYLTVPVSRANFYGRATYDLSDKVMLSADIRYTDVYNHYNFAPDTLTGATIKNDNAFLPAAVKAQMAAAGVTTFTFGRNNDDFEFRDYDYDRRDLQATLGAQGAFGKTWKWDAYYTHGERTVQEVFNHMRITANFNLAIDSVISPTTGQPICRIALTVPTTNCVPINLFGFGNVSQAAANYVNGSSLLRYQQQLDDGGATLRGDLFDLPAGSVSIATGIEVRHEQIKTLEDDPISLTNGFTTVNPKGFDGGFSAREAFFETVVPLVKDVPVFEKLDFNGAARVSDYSNSGTIWAWKAGLTDEVFQGFTLRAVRSRDTRSASLTELFTAGTQATGTISDPVTKTQYTVTQQNGGNKNLLPELSDTTTFGFTYAPSFLEGFEMSIDHYDIDINRAITTLSAQDIVTRCFNGNTALCALITRAGAGNTISKIQSTFINLANYTTRGVDFEASYNLPLERVSSLPGTLRFRALANHIDSLKTNDGVNVIEWAGSVGSGLSFGAPKWQGSLETTYSLNETNLLLRARYVGGGVYDPSRDIANNSVSSKTYFDFAFQQGLSILGHKNFTVYGNINNLFDQAPPPAPNPQFYDVVGRYFELGLKARF